MSDDTHAEKQLRLQIETRCRVIAEKIKRDLLPGTGFSLFMFDLGAGGSLAYVSTATRQSFVSSILELLAHMTSREILAAVDPAVILRLAQRAALAGGTSWEVCSEEEQLRWLEIATTVCEGLAKP